MEGERAEWVMMGVGCVGGVMCVVSYPSSNSTKMADTVENISNGGQKWSGAGTSLYHVWGERGEMGDSHILLIGTSCTTNCAQDSTLHFVTFLTVYLHLSAIYRSAAGGHV